MTAPPTERALAKAREIVDRIAMKHWPTNFMLSVQDEVKCEIALALDDERAAVWEEATKMVNELWSATVPLLPASFIGFGASILRRARAAALREASHED